MKKKKKKLKYIVLEYKPKLTLSTYFIEITKSISERYAKVIFSKIAKGVKEIHNSGICHLDLKLDNILLDEKFNPIICDFGYSIENDNKITECRGTPGYMSPEIFKDEPYDGNKADIFSLGVILLIILTKKKVFFNPKGFAKQYNKNYNKYIDKYYQYIQNNNIDGFLKIIGVDNLNLSKEFKKLFQNMVNFDPKKRPSIEDILDDPWLDEYNKLTDEEKKELENEVIEKEFEERKKILDHNNKNKNLINIKDIIEQVPNMDNKSSGKINESYFDENCKLESIDENNLNLKYYLNIKGTSNPNDLMNALVEKVKAIEIKDDEFRNLDIIPNDKYYKFDVILENNDKEIPEEFKNLGFNDFDDYAKVFGLQDLIIRIKLFKSNNGYLLRFLKKEGNIEDFREYLKKIISSIKG